MAQSARRHLRAGRAQRAGIFSKDGLLTVTAAGVLVGTPVTVNRLLVIDNSVPWKNHAHTVWATGKVQSAMTAGWTVVGGHPCGAGGVVAVIAGVHTSYIPTRESYVKSWRVIQGRLHAEISDKPRGAEVWKREPDCASGIEFHRGVQVTTQSRLQKKSVLGPTVLHFSRSAGSIPFYRADRPGLLLFVQ